MAFNGRYAGSCGLVWYLWPGVLGVEIRLGTPGGAVVSFTVFLLGCPCCAAFHLGLGEGFPRVFFVDLLLPMEDGVHENVGSVGVSSDCASGCVTLTISLLLSKFLFPFYEIGITKNVILFGGWDGGGA